MSTYEEVEAVFDTTARQQIKRDFSSKCALCKVQVQADEGHFLPLLDERNTYIKCVRGLYTTVSMPYNPSNGVYACTSCAHNLLLRTDDKRATIVLIPCQPLMLYALHVQSLAEDEASRSQTLDAMFEDLERDPDSTPERRIAAPFLHCYQSHPVSEHSASHPNSIISVQPSPSTYLTYDGSRPHGSQPSSYLIIEHDAAPDSAGAVSRQVPVYGQCEDGAITLWRLPMRAPGLFLGYAHSAVFAEAGNPAPYKSSWNLPGSCLSVVVFPPSTE